MLCYHHNMTFVQYNDKTMTTPKTGKTPRNRQVQTEAEQLVLVNQDGFAILDIANPSEAVQLAAVNQNGLCITYIKNTSEAVQLASVKQNSDAIQDIEAPSDAVQLAAVEQNVEAIQYIEAPVKAVQYAALTNGMKPRQVNTALLLAQRDLFTTDVLDAINPALCRGLLVIDALGLTDDECVIALDEFLAGSLFVKTTDAVVIESLGDVSL